VHPLTSSAHLISALVFFDILACITFNITPAIGGKMKADIFEV